ncbi:MAG: hypothetical protein E6R13_04215 [Spirochaetes bacterium]|nr:MAG: hypothetical protein E6R13_04215 [Spirochaetota bacterium]
MMYPSLTAREILTTPIADIWSFAKGVYEVIFDDSRSLYMYHSHICFNRLLWEFFKEFPDGQITPNHAFIGDKFGPTTHLKILGEIVWDTFDVYMNKGIQIDMDYLSLRCYQITNLVYNVMSFQLEKYVSSSSLLDYIEIYRDQRISQHVEKVRKDPYPTPTKIETCSNLVTKEIKDPLFQPHNPIVRVLQSGNTKVESALQSVSMRGTATDIDSRLFRKPIVNGYLFGLDKLEDQMMDSRTSAKALSYAKKPMQDSEYLNRKLQLLASSISTLYMEDCGTKRYFDVVLPTFKHLNDYRGKYYFDEEAGVEKEIMVWDTHLIGKTIKLRRVFSCLNHDRHGVCVKCFGSLGYSIPKGTNIGHQCAINLQSPVGQLLLSAKHFTANGTADEFVFSDAEKRYLHIPKSMMNEFYVNKRLSDYRYKIRFYTKESEGIGSLRNTKSFKGLAPTRYSGLSTIKFIIYDELDNPIDVMDVNLATPTASRVSSFSIEALEYIMSMGWENYEDGTCEVDMAGWNDGQPLLIMPMKQFSTPEFMNSIEKFIRGDVGTVKPMIKYDSIEEGMEAFHELVSDKLSINISNLEIIMLSCMISSETDYRPPIDKMQGQLAKYSDIMFNRSLGAFMAYQTQSKAFRSEKSYIYKQRSPHPLDKLLLSGNQFQ